MADKIRLINDGPWTHLPNKTIRDRRLSLRTLGLLLLMHSLPDDWDYTVAGLATICGLHRETVGKALKELEAAGYLSRHQTHGERGVFSGCEYVVSTVSATDEDEPDAPQPSGTLETAETIGGERGQPLPEIPTTVTPSSVLPSSVKPTQRKNRCNNTPLNPPAKKKRRDKSVPRWNPERFEAFWTYYREHARGEDRMGAVREWDKLQLDDATIDLIAKALPQQVKQWAANDGVGVPYACRYLKNRRWEDTPMVITPGAAKEAAGGMEPGDPEAVRSDLPTW